MLAPRPLFLNAVVLSRCPVVCPQDVRLAVEVRRFTLVLPLIDGSQVLAAREAMAPEALSMRTLRVGQLNSAITDGPTQDGAGVVTHSAGFDAGRGGFGVPAVDEVDASVFNPLLFSDLPYVPTRALTPALRARMFCCCCYNRVRGNACVMPSINRYDVQVSVLQLDVNKVTVYTGSHATPQASKGKGRVSMPVFSDRCTETSPLHKTTALAGAGVDVWQLPHYDGVSIFAKGCQLRAMKLSTRVGMDTPEDEAGVEESKQPSAPTTGFARGGASSLGTGPPSASRVPGGLDIVPHGEWGEGLRLLWCSHILHPTDVAAIALKCRNPNHVLLPALAVRLAFSTIRVRVGAATIATCVSLAKMWKGQVQMEALDKEWGDGGTTGGGSVARGATGGGGGGVAGDSLRSPGLRNGFQRGRHTRGLSRSSSVNGGGASSARVRGPTATPGSVGVGAGSLRGDTTTGVLRHASALYARSPHAGSDGAGVVGGRVSGSDSEGVDDGSDSEGVHAGHVRQHYTRHGHDHGRSHSPTARSTHHRHARSPHRSSLRPASPTAHRSGDAGAGAGASDVDGDVDGGDGDGAADRRRRRPSPSRRSGRRARGGRRSGRSRRGGAGAGTGSRGRSSSRNSRRRGVRGHHGGSGSGGGFGLSRAPTLEELKHKPKVALLVSVDGMSLQLMAPPAVPEGDVSHGGHSVDPSRSRSRSRSQSRAESDLGSRGRSTDFTQGTCADTRTVGSVSIDHMVLLAQRRRSFDEMRVELGHFAVVEMSENVTPRCVCCVRVCVRACVCVLCACVCAHAHVGAAVVWFV